MTPHDDARALAEKLLESLAADYSSKNYDTLKEVDIAFKADVALIAAALDQARRETWEAAAQMVEGDCYGEIASVVFGLTDEENRHNANQITLASKLREQATGGRDELQR